MVTFEAILIGTAILWAIEAIIVLPLRDYIVKQKLLEPTYAHMTSDGEILANHPEYNSLATRWYMIVDTLVLGVVGFLLGVLLGWFFVGITTRARGWPGMIAFMVMSIMGASMRLHFVHQ